MAEKKNQSRYLVFAFKGWTIAIYMLIGFVLPVILFEIVFINEIEIALIVALACNILSIFIIQRIGLSPIRISFDQERITFDYLKRDLTTIRKTKPILMKYVYGFYDMNFGSNQTFKLKLPYGATFSLYKNTIWNKKDDFEILIDDFKEFIKDYNNSRELDTDDKNDVRANKIEYTDFFHTQKATVLFYSAIAVGVLLIIGMINANAKNLSGGIIAFGGILGYIGLYMIRRKKKNN